jgi:ATP-dependent Clp protease, protease subunit
MNHNINNYTAPFLNEEDDDEEDHDDKKSGKDMAAAMMPEMQFEKKFIEQRKIFLWGVVDDKSARYIVNRLMYLEAKDPGKEITFYINSPGGIVTSGMVIHDTMKMISSPVSTICMGLAASMGSILLSAGAKGKRFIYPSGEVMIHQPSLGGMMRGTSADLEIQAVQIRKTKRLGAQILADNCGKSIDEILKDFERDYWMDANEAVAYGIVDGVLHKL